MIDEHNEEIRRISFAEGFFKGKAECKAEIIEECLDEFIDTFIKANQMKQMNKAECIHSMYVIAEELKERSN